MSDEQKVFEYAVLKEAYENRVKLCNKQRELLDFCFQFIIYRLHNNQDYRTEDVKTAIDARIELNEI